MPVVDFNFILPPPSKVPVGGYKVVYEYANRLSSLGYNVNITYICIHKSLIRNIISYAKNIPNGLRPRWFNLGIKVKTRFILPTENAFLGQGCKFVIATAWQTAELAEKIVLSGKASKGMYLIQDYEVWSGTPEEVHLSYNRRLDKIAISKWLRDIVVSRGLDCEYVPNGLNFKEFYVENAIHSRKPSLLGLYHILEKKGSKDTIDAFVELYELYKDVNYVMYGAYDRPENMPSWITYYKLPNRDLLRKLYNEASIFIAPSHSEGWGLPACESMQCGCCLVASNIPGHQEFAADGENSLFFAAGNKYEIIERVQRLLKNDELRIKIAEQGHQTIQKFSWDESLHKFVEICRLKI